MERRRKIGGKVLSKKIVHKRDARIPLLAEAIEMGIGEPVTVVEKIVRR